MKIEEMNPSELAQKAAEKLDACWLIGDDRSEDISDEELILRITKALTPMFEKALNAVPANSSTVLRIVANRIRRNRNE